MGWKEIVKNGQEGFKFMSKLRKLKGQNREVFGDVRLEKGKSCHGKQMNKINKKKNNKG